MACIMFIGNEDYFCAGWDLTVLDGITGRDQARFTELATRLMTAIYD